MEIEARQKAEKQEKERKRMKNTAIILMKGSVDGLIASTGKAVAKVTDKLGKAPAALFRRDRNRDRIRTCSSLPESLSA